MASTALIRSSIYFGGILAIMASLLVHCHCRAVNEPGSTSTTTVKNFAFMARLANPCEADPIYPVAIVQSASLSNDSDTFPPTNGTSSILLSSSSDRVQVYQSMVLSLHLTLNKLRVLEATDPSLPECNTFWLSSLPTPPLLNNLNGDEVIREAYQMNIFLASHFHLMSLDRQLTLSMDADQPEDELEDEAKVPTWRFRKCGEESKTFPSSLIDVTEQLENVLCTIVTGVSNEQRTAFNGSMNLLQETTFFRYHTSCTLLQQRDCMAVKAAKETTSEFLRRINDLISSEARSSAGSMEDDDMMDNNL